MWIVFAVFFMLFLLDKEKELKGEKKGPATKVDLKSYNKNQKVTQKCA
jgi:hypothetical protein